MGPSVKILLELLMGDKWGQVLKGFLGTSHELSLRRIAIFSELIINAEMDPSGKWQIRND